MEPKDTCMRYNNTGTCLIVSLNTNKIGIFSGKQIFKRIQLVYVGLYVYTQNPHDRKSIFSESSSPLIAPLLLLTIQFQIPLQLVLYCFKVPEAGSSSMRADCGGIAIQRRCLIQFCGQSERNQFRWQLIRYSTVSLLQFVVQG